VEINKNIVLILLILALFTGATIEVCEGSIYTGIGLFIAAAFLFTRFKLTNSINSKSSKLYLLVGFIIVITDIIYNFNRGSSFGTLDTMTFFLGVSLMAFGIGNQQFQRMGEFGAYISVVFIVLFLFFYSILGTLNINFMHVFDHYFILLPTVGILGLIGIPLKVVATETVCLQGVEEMTIIIGGPCSGLYSMFLLMGLIFGYSRVEKIEFKKTLLILGFSMLVAYLSNLFRVIILYLTAYTYGKETMMLVHTHLGWIIFAIIAAFIMYFVEIKNK
jgi:archaeosortase C (PEF-CTERM variant)